MHRHLQRLTMVWASHPLVFVTACTAARRPVLCDPGAVDVLVNEWRDSKARHGWRIGRYVVMPDHVHFFCAAEPACPAKPLPQFVGLWKEWTAKGLIKRLGLGAPVWQKQFFDHVLRSGESYAEKWSYVRSNPVRAGLVNDAENWAFSGAIDFDDPV
jgi:REP element-mobilizing transposase RayT